MDTHISKSVKWSLCMNISGHCFTRCRDVLAQCTMAKTFVDLLVDALLLEIETLIDTVQSWDIAIFVWSMRLRTKYKVQDRHCDQTKSRCSNTYAEKNSEMGVTHGKRSISSTKVLHHLWNVISAWRSRWSESHLISRSFNRGSKSR